MNTILQKVLYASVGVTAAAIQQLQHTAQVVSQQTQRSQADGKQTVTQFSHYIERKTDALKQQYPLLDGQSLTQLMSQRWLPTSADIKVAKSDVALF